MQIAKSIVAILWVSIFSLVNPIYAAAVPGASTEMCATLLSPEEEHLNFQEKKFVLASVELSQQALNQSLVSFPDLAKSLANEGYRFYQTLFKGYFHEVNVFKLPSTNGTYDASSPVREYVDSIGALDPADRVKNNPRVGKAILRRLLANQERHSLSEADRMWSRLSAVRVLNAMIKDGHLFNRQYTEMVLQETAREIEVAKVYPDNQHMDVKLNSWIKEGRWSDKKESIQRISFFILQSLQVQTKDFARYRFLMNIEHNERAVFNTFLREFIEATIVDSLQLAAATLQTRPHTWREGVRDVRGDALLAAAAAGSVAGVYMANDTALGVAAGVGAACGSAMLTLKAYDNLKVWLAQRRLKMRWKASTEEKCQNYFKATLEMMRE